MEERNNGSQLEGIWAELGGLMIQDTNGGIDYRKRTITNEGDGGVDAELSVAEDIDLDEYIDTLMKE